MNSPAVKKLALDFPPVAAAAGILVPFIVLTGWAFNIEIFKTFIPGLVAMNPGSAILFFLASISLYFLYRPRNASKVFVSGAAAAILTLGLVRILGYAYNWSWNFDQILFTVKLGANRMAPTTALNFCLLGIALFIKNSGRSRIQWITECCLITVIIISLFSIVGYTYSVMAFTRFRLYIPMAIHTALVFVTLAAGIFTLNPNQGVSSLLNTKNIGSIMARRLLPSAILTPFIIEGLRHVTHLTDADLPYGYGMAISTLTTIFLFTVLILWSASKLNRLEKEHEHSEMRLKLALDSAEMGIWDLDLINNTVLRTLRHDQIYGYSTLQPDWSPEIFYKHVIAEDLAYAKNTLETTFANKEADGFHLECRIKRANDGAVRWVLAEGRLHRDPKGNPVRMMGVITDITEKKRTLEDVKHARDTAMEASHAKSDFLATMSHEIRTPMNAIVGMAELLSETPLNSEQHEYIQILKRGGETLLMLINDILDLSKVEAGHLELEQIPFDLNEFMERTAEFIAIRAHQKKLELVCRIHPDVPQFVIGDPNRLRQILINLLSNAVKFTKQGEIALEVKKAGSNGRFELLFSVSDTGIGIPEDKMAAVFEPFTQADSSTTREYGGTGLGLSISKKLVELMGGTIQAKSQVGHGTTFSFNAFFKIPVQSLASNTPVPPAENLGGLKALVVDDNATNRLILKEILNRWGIYTAEVPGGEECLQELRRAQKAGESYQLLLLDCRMPGLSGFDIAKKIKEDPIFKTLIVMMLPSDSRAGDIALSRDLGLAGYLVKPVKKEDLRQAIQNAVGNVLPPKAQAPPVPEQPQMETPLKILLVEDSQDNRLLILSYLKKFPYQIDIAENGQVALEKATAENYDLVFMDMHMPVMDGYTATRKIREWEKTNRAGNPLKIIALTADALKEDVKKTLESGCNAHLTKPIKKADLLAAITHYANTR